ncbi:hypothetical protein PVOR_28099 [Paenibacillus vortex V453]|uniref:Cytoplasmic protein n=2 Tax=Paenibacillus TaxID=44249 RepID=A0A163FVW8_9BACL|nr:MULTISPECIES: DUF1259 domain-containing protein [Paenibacillus]AWP26050.1 hypothetical protein B9D94_05260 [Paenibacillus sp. Cedars]EFU38910.1 hypothetical protein PVOR_28099 [Paenibacillus vortex V453]KZS44583.1 hypothetical protein AWU65_31525 [Paenibacillus glucanolyticus]MPY18512.1 DUF1259 domain-containing protein [Paenibacillus glucanolyticus]
MKISEALCKRLATILGGTGMSDGKSCSIMVERKLNARVLGRKYETEHEITIQSPQNGTTLNTGEITLLQSEVQRFIDAARKRNFKVSAIHNHWLFDKPRLMYLHIESIENPIVFARKLRSALDILKK